MPTVLERIDVLKKQVEKAGKSKEAEMIKISAAAEIVALRNLSGAEQGKKETLKTKLTAEQMAELKDQVEILKKDPEFIKMMKDPNAVSLLTSGHGGDMLEYLRTPDTREIWKLMDESKKKIAEYLALDTQSRKKIKGKENIEAALLKDCPREKINEQIEKRESNPAFKQLTKELSPNKTVAMLGNMATKSPDEFIYKLSYESNKIPILPTKKRFRDQISAAGPFCFTCFV